MKRALFVFLFLGLFWRPLLEFGGTKLSSFYFFCRGIRFEVSAVHLSRDKLTLYDFSFDDPAHGSVEGKEATIWFWRRHLEVERGSFVLRELPSLKKGGRWSFAFREGSLAGEGIAPLYFAAESSFTEGGKEHIVASFDWGRGIFARGDIWREGERIWGEVEADHFSPQLLTRWFGRQWHGLWGGKVALSFDQVLTGRIEGKEIGWKNLLQQGKGHVEFRVPLELSRWEQEGDLRWEFSNGRFLGEDGEIAEIEAEGMLAAGVGAHASLKGLAHFKDKTEVLLCEGKGRFGEEKWVEASVSLGETQGKFQWGGELWNFICEEMGPWEAALVRSCLSPFFPDEANRFQNYWFDQGKIFWKLAGDGFSISSFEGEAIKTAFRFDSLEVFAQKAQLEHAFLTGDGAFSFEGGSIALGQEKKVALEGRGRFAEEVMCDALFSLGLEVGEGKNVALEVSPQGTWDAWEASFQMRGDFEGEGKVQGKWAGDKWLYSLREGKWGSWTLEGTGGVGWEDFYAKWDRFEGPVDELLEFIPLPLSKGNLLARKDGLTLWGKWNEMPHWALQATLSEGEGHFYSFDLRNVKGEIDLSPTTFSLRELRGEVLAGASLPFYCPFVERGGLFDIRIEDPLWDRARIKGIWEGETIQIDPEGSFFLGAYLQQGTISWGETPLSLFQFRLQCEEARAALQPLLPSLAMFPVSGELEVEMLFEQGGQAKVTVDDVAFFYDKERLPFHAELISEEGRWRLQSTSIGPWSFAAALSFQEQGIKMWKGKAKKEGELFIEFEGRLDREKGMDLHLHRVEAEAQFGAPWEPRLAAAKGQWVASGHASWQDNWEIDLDLEPFAIEVAQKKIESRGPLHIYLAPKNSLLIRGIDWTWEGEEGRIQAKADLLSYGEKDKKWEARGAQLQISEEILKHWPPLQEVQLGTVNLRGDFEVNSDLSWLHASLQNGRLEREDVSFQGEEIELSWNGDRFELSLLYTHAGQPIEIDLFADLSSEIGGRLFLHEPMHPEEMPLLLDWEYRPEDGFSLLSAEGSFGGVEALFHTEAKGGNLIGSARIDCKRLASFVPPDIAKVFRELKMESGYEIKGHLGVGKEGLSFDGLLGGKQCTLFGFQLKTLLGQIAWGPGFFSLKNLKISDAAGMLTAERVDAWNPSGGAPWRLSIPLIALAELRPSLLQKKGEKLGPMTPLVVRNFFLRDLQGELEKSQTWTAHGDFRFINSFKREYTLADIPSDVLSRIFGLDLELLVPVCGQSKFVLENGFFRLKELENSYSEGKRSEFFLLEEGGSPTMDLDGNLKIWITMKQFVLFKFTESFLISIEGRLNDPKFRLKKKKGFLNLSKEQETDL